jgi:hypothetical protein
MTDPSAEATVATVQPVAELFTSAATALWATTYNVHLSLFNEFLLGRLGDPPLNVAVLADQRRLAASLARIPAERVETLAAVNQRWLLRGVRLGGQAFHPKTYLAATGSRATLLVGSGNLSTGGLDEGREVFTTFRSGTPVGDSAIAAWRSWMRRLVQLVGDTTLAERFRDLDARIPPPPTVAPAVPSPLLHNLDIPIALQLAAPVADGVGQVDELWLTAPFYDPDADAVGALLETFKPARVRMFVTGSTSVNGDRLAERLTASRAEVTVAAYEPDRFVHAKLVGVIAGTRGWLLSGSANLSQAALTRTPANQGNVELAVLAALDPDQIRAVFVPPGMTVAKRSLDSLVSLNYRDEPEPDLPSVRLVTAAPALDGRIEVVSDPSAADGWLLDDLTDRQPLTDAGEGRAVTAGPLAGRLVQLVDGDGQVLSNRVVVDNPAALAAALTAGSGHPRTDRPPELTSGDLDTPLGQALDWLHRNLVMDVSERVTAAPTGGVGAGEVGDQADDDLWERLEQHQLARDPRASTYGRMWRHNTLGGSEPIIELLEALRYRIPTESATTSGTSLLAHLLDRQRDREPGDSDGKPVRRWKASTRIRVRARNLLRRWAAAQTDPRLVWVDPLAPAGNFAMITGTLAHLRLERAWDPERVEFTDDDLDDLWQRWLRPFTGTGEGDGWLDQLDHADLSLARDRLPEWLPEAVAALCWLVVQPGRGYRERVVAVQPVLAATFAHDLVEPTDMTARYLSAVTSRTVTRTEVDSQLLNAVEYIDDALWCSRTAEELALDELNFQAPPGAARVQVRLDVRGITNPLFDPRIPRLVVLVRHYRRCDGVALFAADASWRLSFATGQTIACLPSLDASMIESTIPLADGVLESLAGSAGVLADLFPAAEQVA